MEWKFRVDQRWSICCSRWMRSSKFTGTIGAALLSDLLITLPFFAVVLQRIFFPERRETNHLVWVMSRIVCREFSHNTKYCKMFYTVTTLGWHSETPMTEFLFHVILISTGTCTNLTSSNWSDLSQKCCPLWPNSPEVMPGKIGSQIAQPPPPLPSWVYSLAFKVLLFSSLSISADLAKKVIFIT